MSKKYQLKPVAAIIGAAFATSMSASASADITSNPFSMSDLSTGYMVAMGSKEEKKAEGKCGEGKCGDTKKAEGKCGEGKCGDTKKAEGKCGEGKCGDTKKAKPEGKCGEGKCGAK